MSTPALWFLSSVFQSFINGQVNICKEKINAVLFGQWLGTKKNLKLFILFLREKKCGDLTLKGNAVIWILRHFYQICISSNLELSCISQSQNSHLLWLFPYLLLMGGSQLVSHESVSWHINSYVRPNLAFWWPFAISYWLMYPCKWLPWTSQYTRLTIRLTRLSSFYQCFSFVVLVITPRTLVVKELNPSCSFTNH